jgi:hypothetical protein
MIVAAAAMMLAACLPIPDLRLDAELPEPTYRLPPGEVRVAHVNLPGYPEPHTPARLNRALYLRYHAEEGEPADTVDTIFVLMPGISGGAASLDVYARQLVASTPGLEVWAVDRRSNLLEDREVFLESVRQGDPMLAYHYYVENAGREGGFQPLSPEDLRFMAFWGLEVHLHDLHVIVERAREQAERVILGGHSLGASIISFYSAFDFAATTPQPGYSFIDGLVLIDGGLGRTGGYGRGDLFTVGPFALVPTIAELEAGVGSPFLSLGRNPRTYARQEAAALLALLAPDELSPGGFFDFPATNRAVAGLLVDDHYAPSTAFSASVGRSVGADYAGNLTAVIIGGLEGVTSRSVVGVAPGREYVDWERGDPRRERSNLDDVLRAWAMPETNFTEWYFPLRLLLDMAELDLRLTDTPGFVPTREVPTPTLAVGAGRGLVSGLDGFSAYMNVRAGAPFASHILPGLTHFDIVMAENNPLVPLTQLWLRSLP